MNALRSIAAIARADFLERVRRYSFLVTLLFAAYLGYATARGQISLQLDEYRGVYTSAWIGTLVALVTACFVSLVGFYIVRNSVDRDRSTGVGQILAGTSLANPSYTFGKFLSNFAVLASMVVVLALGALAMQFLVAEDPHVDLWALLAPFLLLDLPVMALTASIAVFFEVTPILRSGVGNVGWFFAWSFGISLPLLTGVRWLDPLGIFGVMESLSAEARRHIPDYQGGMAFQINFGQIRIAPDLRWFGIPWTWDAILVRLSWFGVAGGLALLSSILFDRFDSAQADRHKQGKQKKMFGNGSPTLETPARPAATVHLSPLSASERSVAFGRIFSAELRLALQGLRWWWYAVATGLLIAQFASPLEISRGPLLGVAWLWPVLIWSAMGARESRFATRQLLFSCARILPRQLAACYLAGVIVALLTGAGAGFRLVLTRDFFGVFAFLVAAFFIPALALALGVVSGSGKFFEAFFTLLWYIGPMNHVPGFDFTGAANGPLALRYALIYLSFAAVLLATAFLARARQLLSD